MDGVRKRREKGLVDVVFGVRKRGEEVRGRCVWYPQEYGKGLWTVCSVSARGQKGLWTLCSVFAREERRFVAVSARGQKRLVDGVFGVRKRTETLVLCSVSARKERRGLWTVCSVSART